MSTANPTLLQVGAQGVLNGWSVRVAGRVVLGIEDGGETYYWNEFNLVDDGGESATLVFEDTEDGHDWKLFRGFVPRRPLTAAEAATKRTGELVDLDGTPRPITLVDQSRVYHIEGTAPEGVEVGDVADYFNVDTGELMLVASWTGDEIEFYEGYDLAVDAVAKAFGLPLPAPSPPAARFTSGEGAGGFLSRISLARVIQVLVGLGVLGSFVLNWSPSRFSLSAPAAKAPAPVMRIASGTSGVLGGSRYTVASHAVVEIARMGGRFDRHEYQLSDDTGRRALLVQGLNGNPKEWHLLVPRDTPSRLDPYQAAALRKDAAIAGDPSMRITVLFQCRRLSLDGDDPNPWPAVIQYGFVAANGSESLVARWTENGIQFHRGARVPEPAVLAAFTPGSK